MLLVDIIISILIAVIRFCSYDWSVVNAVLLAFGVLTNGGGCIHI